MGRADGGGGSQTRDSASGSGLHEKFQQTKKKKKMLVGWRWKSTAVIEEPADNYIHAIGGPIIKKQLGQDENK